MFDTALLLETVLFFSLSIEFLSFFCLPVFLRVHMKRLPLVVMIMIKKKKNMLQAEDLNVKLSHFMQKNGVSVVPWVAVRPGVGKPWPVDHNGFWNWTEGLQMVYIEISLKMLENGWNTTIL